MKKWEYMFVGFQENKVRNINSEKVDNFKIQWLGTSTGNDKTEFLNKIGQEGWEAVGFIQDGVGDYSTGNILLKREIKK